MDVLPNNNNKLYGGAWSIHDTELLKATALVPKHSVDTNVFCRDYKNWIATGKNFKGWNDFKYLDFSNGTTETFDKFYQTHANLRLRLMRGEYFYHQLQAKLVFKNRFKWMGEAPLAQGDVLVISCPFSDTGNIPDDFDNILLECDKLSIPVLLDMAYISISDIHELDLYHPCIKIITSSLSKVFPVEQHRIGIRMRREFTDDTLAAYNQHQYVNRHSVNLGHHMINSFPNNWLIEKYKKRQTQICGELGVNVSSCTIFGIDTNNKFPEYNRGNTSNRLCFSKIWDNRC